MRVCVLHSVKEVTKVESYPPFYEFSFKEQLFEMKILLSGVHCRQQHYSNTAALFLKTFPLENGD